MISGLRAKEYEGKLMELGLETLATRREKADLVLANKIINKTASLDPLHWFELSDPDSGVTRAASGPLHIIQKRCRLDTRKSFFTNRVAASWNRLLEAVRTAALEKFKRSYDLLHRGGHQSGEGRSDGRQREDKKNDDVLYRGTRGTTENYTTSTSK